MRSLFYLNKEQYTLQYHRRGDKSYIKKPKKAIRVAKRPRASQNAAPMIADWKNLSVIEGFLAEAVNRFPNIMPTPMPGKNRQRFN